MLGHLGINVPDLAAAKSYYDALMPLVGFESFLATDDQFAFRPAGVNRALICSSIRRPKLHRIRGIVSGCSTWLSWSRPEQRSRMSINSCSASVVK